MFTIQKVKSKFYVFEDGYFYAQFKTKAIAERVIADVLRTRAEVAEDETRACLARVERALAYVAMRRAAYSRQLRFNF